MTDIKLRREVLTFLDFRVHYLQSEILLSSLRLHATQPKPTALRLMSDARFRPKSEKLATSENESLGLKFPADGMKRGKRGTSF